MNILNKTGSIVLATVPILGIYRFYQGINFDILILSLFALIQVLYVQKVNFKAGILGYFGVLLVINLLSFILTDNQISSIFISNTLYIICFALLLGYYVTFEPDDLFVRSILFIGIISTVLVFYQAILFRLFGISSVLFFPLDMVIPPAPDFPSITYGRPNSIFTEPAHYAIFILPLLWYSIVNQKHLLTGLFIAGLVLSTSVTGLVVGLIILLLQTVFKEKNLKVLPVIVLLSLGLLVVFPEIFSNVKYFILPKITDIETLTKSERFFSTFIVFSKMDFFSILFGLGHNQLKEFMLQNGMPNAWNFANSFLMSVFSFGILGLILLLFFLYYLYKINNDKGYFIILFLILMSDQILFNRNFFYLITCIFLIKDTKDKSDNIVIEEDNKEILETV
jgi:hypothetical protein